MKYTEKLFSWPWHIRNFIFINLQGKLKLETHYFQFLMLLLEKPSAITSKVKIIKIKETHIK